MQEAPAKTERSPSAAQAVVDDSSPSWSTSAYERLGSPRLAVFATRSFGGEVNEWRPVARTSAGSTTRVRDQGSSGARASGHGESRTKTHTQGQPEAGGAEPRAPASTSDEVAKSSWAESGQGWHKSKTTIKQESDAGTMEAAPQQRRAFTEDELLFERAFVKELSAQGLVVIDRDVIVRAQAARHQSADVMRQTVLAESVLESYALESNVDLIVTIDMLESPERACIERRYLAVAKTIPAGEVWATADSDDAKEQFEETRVRGTADGYRRVTSKAEFDCADLARALAGELLEALAHRAR